MAFVNFRIRVVDNSSKCARGSTESKLATDENSQYHIYFSQSLQCCRIWLQQKLQVPQRTALLTAQDGVVPDWLTLLVSGHGVCACM